MQLSIQMSFLQVDNKLEMIPLVIEPIDEVPTAFGEVPGVDATSSFNDTVDTLVQAVVNFTEGQEKDLTVFREVKVRPEKQNMCVSYNQPTLPQGTDPKHFCHHFKRNTYKFSFFLRFFDHFKFQVYFGKMYFFRPILGPKLVENKIRKESLSDLPTLFLNPML